MFNTPLIIFFIVIGAYLWYTFSIIYHLIRFGVGREPKILALIFFIGSSGLFIITLVLYFNIDWKETFQQLFSNITFFGK